MSYSALFKNLLKPITTINVQQIRNKWVNHLMIRDVKRRAMVTEYTPLRLRLNAIKRNDILPLELKKVTSAEMHALPRDSCWRRINYRCVVTSRPRGNVHRWRISRFVFRSLADYNKLSGVQRALW
ncbi:hypothetical protein FQA39_LY06784 [Lamprigera yunnana]|nr:hypothetical protein FQA39_LY06784 [Lamprigera yunnana]